LSPKTPSSKASRVPSREGEVTRTALLDAAQVLMRTRGYAGFSYRDISLRVGIRNASIHHHFPSKAALGAALAKRHVEAAMAELEQAGLSARDASSRVAHYAGLFRNALELNGMCLCGMIAAEVALVPPEMTEEVRRFIRFSVDWLSESLQPDLPHSEARRRALHVVATLEGAALMAHGFGDISFFDDVAAQLLDEYRTLSPAAGA
jgi:TetR/AcrR family transcriptional repressor of nem operon